MQIRTIFKWSLRLVAGLLGLAALAVLAIYVIIRLDLSQTYEIEVTSIDVPADALSIAEGERLARLRGCNGGCHGDSVNGEIFIDLFDGTHIAAPDLARIAQDYSNAELQGAIRHGVRPDGTSLLSIMPSSMFYGLGNDELAAIIAFLRSQTPVDTQPIERTVGPLASIMMFYFKQLAGTILAAEEIDLMAQVAKPRFTYFTDSEIHALHFYLQTLVKD